MENSLTTGPPQFVVRLRQSLDRLGERWRNDLTEAVCQAVALALRAAVGRFVGGVPTVTRLREPYRTSMRAAWDPGDGSEANGPSSPWDDPAEDFAEDRADDPWDQWDRPRTHGAEEEIPAASTTPQTGFRPSPTWTGRTRCLVAVGVGVLVAAVAYLASASSPPSVTKRVLALLALVEIALTAWRV